MARFNTTLFSLPELRRRLGPAQRLLGIDLGSRTVGIALSDVSLRLASPYGHWPRGKLADTVEDIRRVAHTQGVGGLVVGWPLSMDGSVGPAAQAARDWAHAIAAQTGLPTALWDERLSSAAVNRALLADDTTRRRRAELVDQMAAAWILQAALDASRDDPEDDPGADEPG